MGLVSVFIVMRSERQRVETNMSIALFRHKCFMCDDEKKLTMTSSKQRRTHMVIYLDGNDGVANAMNSRSILR